MILMWSFLKGGCLMIFKNIGYYLAFFISLFATLPIALNYWCLSVDKWQILFLLIISNLFLFVSIGAGSIARVLSNKNKLKDRELRQYQDSQLAYLYVKTAAGFSATSNFIGVIYFILVLSLPLEEVSKTAVNSESNDYLSLSAAVFAVVIAVITAYYLVAIQGTYNQAKDLLNKLESWKREVEQEIETQKISLNNIRHNHIGGLYLHGYYITEIYQLLSSGLIEITDEGKVSAKQSYQEVDHIRGLLNVLNNVYGESNAVSWAYNREFYSVIKQSIEAMEALPEGVNKVPQEIFSSLANYMTGLLEHNTLTDQEIINLREIRAWAEGHIKK